MSVPGSRIGKLTYFILVASVILFVGISVTSAMQAELRGGIAFGLIVSGVLLIPVLVFANWVPEVVRATKGVWLAYCVIGLGLLLKASIAGGEKDIDIVATILISVLAFPIGIPVALLGTKIFSSTSTVTISLVLWVVAIPLGYWQWFSLLPRILRKNRPII
jgi:hypothetical protein